VKYTKCDLPQNPAEFLLTASIPDCSIVELLNCYGGAVSGIIPGFLLFWGPLKPE